ncbi:MAG: TetR/AcrR family transcriptional regulator [Nitrospirae bacterium]|nr:TetR/AcrR family transcriptional regulator [Nitrospirota bacterium]
MNARKAKPPTAPTSHPPLTLVRIRAGLTANALPDMVGTVSGSPVRRQKILSVAARIFSRNGYHETHVSDIIHGARIARGTFYLYFDSKQDILNELIDVFLARLDSAIKKVDLGRNAPPFSQQIESNLSRVLALIESERELASILLDRRVTLDPAMERRVDVFYDSLCKMTRNALIQGVRFGLIRRCDEGLTAHFIVGGLKEIFHRCVVQKRHPTRLKESMSELFQIILQAIGTDRASFARRDIRAK